MKSVRIALVVLLSLAVICEQTLKRHNVTDWKFKIDGKFESQFYPAKVPSTLHLDLLENKLLEDPFVARKANDAQWLRNVKAVYKTTFKINVQKEDTAELVFEGLDTYATVLLNGKEMLSTDNAFVKWIIPFQLIPDTEYTVEVHFKNSPEDDDKNQGSVERLPFAYGHTRKAAYQHGWDWAPTLVTVGIWKQPYVLYGSKSRIDYVWIRNKELSPILATLNFAVVVKSHFDLTEPHHVEIFVDNKSLSNFEMKEKIGYQDVLIDKPIYWWPRNVGKPHCYVVQVKLFDQSKKLLDTWKINYGIRSVQVEFEGGEFRFVVNGKSVYMKGGNYVPPDMFQPRFENPAFKPGASLQHYVKTMVDSNYNMIRVWGGGQYESDEFYNQCTINGIMIFQDFMFSVNIYPGHQKFLRSCEVEIKQQVQRLRNYAAIGLWSGNNEILQGILSWGWGAENYRKNYNLLFEKLIPGILKHESPDISYIPSSPQFGLGVGGQKGDVHSWSVWAGGAMFDNYEQFIGKFNSQFGTQAIPVYETVKFFMNGSKMAYDNQDFIFHEKHGSQFSVLKSYMGHYMNPSKNFEMEIYQSSLVQAYGVGLAIQAHRIAKPQTWGTLYWQFNDAWPGISWASMDYFGRWKALQYFARRLYSDPVVVFKGNSKAVHAFAASDLVTDLETEVTIVVANTQGKELMKQKSTVKIPANQKVSVLELTQAKMKEFSSNYAKDLVVYSILTTPNDNVVWNSYTVALNKDLQLHPANLTVEYNQEENSMTVSTDGFLKSVFVDLKDGNYVRLSDNYFDLLSGFPLQIQFKDVKLGQIKGSLRFTSYLHSHTDGQLSVTFK